jgi:DNA-binding response OmpR family regulator
MRALFLTSRETVDADLLAVLRHGPFTAVQVLVARADAPALSGATFDVVLVDGEGSSTRETDVAVMRARLPLVPILVFLPEPSAADRVRYLDAGADHCMSRSFDPDELNARLRAVMRRYPQDVLHLGTFLWNWRTRVAQIDGVPMSLPRVEAILLEELLKALNRVAPLKALTARIGSAGQEKANPRLYVYISRLRKRLAGTGLRIQSSNRSGYALVFEPERSNAAAIVPSRGCSNERAPTRSINPVLIPDAEPMLS